MEKIKILHTSDLHLGSAFKGMDSSRSSIRQKELLESFVRIVDIVKQENIELFLLAGDIFDHSDCIHIAEFVSAKLNEIPNTHVFIVAGNHDPKLKVYDKITWGKNVHIFDGKLERVSLENCNVYGASFLETYQKAPLIEPIEIDDKINILLIHGDFNNSEYNLITLQDLSLFDYTALGHIHQYSGIQQSNGTFWAYSGIPEGRGFDELGEKGVIIGEVGKKWVDLSFRPTMQRKYHKLDIDISSCDEHQDIVKSIKHQLCIDDLYDIRLIGNTEQSISLDYLHSAIENDCFFAKIKNDTTKNINYDLIENSYSLQGLFVKKMKNLIEQESDDNKKKQYVLALEMGIQALNGEGIILD